VAACYRKIWLLMLLALLHTGQAAAQSPETEKPFRIGISLGYSFTGYREETNLSLNRYLNTLTYIIDGNIEKGSLLHSFNIGFFRGENEAITAKPLYEIKIDPLIQPFASYQNETIYTRGYLEYALDRRLWGNQMFPGYLGGAFRGDVYVMETAIYPTFTVLASLDVHATQKWIINAENIFVFSAGFPIFGYAFRPSYFGMVFGYEEMEKRITSLHNYWAVFGDLKYHHKINALVSLYSGLGFELSRINFPQPRLDAIFRLNAGVAFSF